MQHARSRPPCPSAPSAATGDGSIPSFIGAGALAHNPFPTSWMPVVGRTLRGWKLDVVSPYMDGPATSAPLRELSARLGVRLSDVRMAVPEQSGLTTIPEELFDGLRTDGATWGHLPASLRDRDESPTSPKRRAHAKVYRFYRGTEEVLYVGSANLTRPGHAATGNVEAGVLYHRRHDRPLRSWITQLAEPMAFVAEAVSEAESATEYTHPLILRYDWATARRELAGLWQSKDVQPELTVKSRGVSLFTVAATSLTHDNWTPIDSADPDALERHLRSSSFLTVADPEGREGTVLVLEVDMAYRPSVLLDLTPAEILEYWALLSDEQRAEWLAKRAVTRRTSSKAPKAFIRTSAARPYPRRCSTGSPACSMHSRPSPTPSAATSRTAICVRPST